MRMPSDLRDSLSDSVLSNIERWWSSLTLEQQIEVCDVSKPFRGEHVSIASLNEMDPADDHFQIYEYLVNHELRSVKFIADAQQAGFHKIATTYLATLGSDYRHGERGTVQ